MAADAKVVLENKADGYLTEDKQVKGGWITIQQATDMDALNPVALKEGSICYCVANGKYYRWTGQWWTEHKFRAIQTSRSLKFTYEDGTSETISVLIYNS